MTWKEVVLDWVNCVDLNKHHNLINNLSELRDGYFFGQVLEKQFLKANVVDVFRELKFQLQGKYATKWIRWDLVQQGDEDELLKIISILIGTSPFRHNGRDYFCNKPAQHLKAQHQRYVMDFVVKVMENGHIVDENCYTSLYVDPKPEVNENVPSIQPRVLFPPMREERYGSPLSEQNTIPLSGGMSEMSKKLEHCRRLLEVSDKCKNDFRDSFDKETKLRAQLEEALKAERKEASRLRQHLDKMKSTVEDVQTENELLFQKNQDFKTELASSRNETTRFQKRLNETQGYLNEKAVRLELTSSELSTTLKTQRKLQTDLNLTVEQLNDKEILIANERREAMLIQNDLNEQLKKLQDDFNCTDEQLSTAQFALRSCEHTNSFFKDNIEQKEMQLAILKQDLTDLKTETRELEVLKKDLLVERKLQENVISDQARNIVDLEGTVSRLNAELTLYQVNEASMSEELNKLQNDFRSKEEELSQALRVIGTCDDSILQLTDKLDRTESQLTTLKDELDKSGSEGRELKVALTKLLAEAKAQKKAAIKLSASIDDLRGKRLYLTEELTKARDTQTRLNKELDKSREDLCRKEAELDEALSSLDAICGSLKLQTKDVEQMELKMVSLEEEFTKANNSVVELEATKTKLLAEAVIQSGVVADLNGAIEELNRSKICLHEELTSERGSKDRLNEKLNKLQEELSCKDSDCSEALSSLRTREHLILELTESLDQKEIELDSLREKLTKTTNTVFELEAMKLVLSEEAKSQAKALAAASAEVEELREKQVRVAEELTTTYASQHNLTQKLDKLESDFNLKGEQMSATQSSLQLREEAISNLTLELDEKTKQLASLNKELKETNDEMRKLQLTEAGLLAQQTACDGITTDLMLKVERLEEARNQLSDELNNGLFIQEELKGEIARLTEKLCCAEAEMSIAAACIRDSQECISKLTQSVEDKDRNMITLTEKCELANDEIQELNLIRDELIAAHRSKQDELTAMIIVLAQLQCKEALLTEGLTSTRNALDCLDEERKQLQANFTYNEEQLCEAHSSLQVRDDTVSLLEKKCDKAELQLDSLTQKLQEAEMKRDELESRNIQMARIAEAGIQEKLVADLTAAAQELEREWAVLNDSLSTANACRDGLNEELSKLQDVLKSSRVELSEALSSLEASEHWNAVQREIVSKTESELLEKELAINHSKKEIEDLKFVQLEMLDTLKKQASTITGLDSTVEQFRRKATLLGVELAMTKIDKDSLTEEVEKLRERLGVNSEQLSVATASLRTYENAEDIMSKQLDEKDEQLQCMLMELNTTKHNLRHLESMKCDFLSSQKSQLNQLADLAVTVAELRSKEVLLLSELSLAVGFRERLNTEVNKLRDGLKFNEDQLSQTMSSLRACETSVSLSEQKLDQRINQIFEMNLELTETKNELQLLKSKIHNLEMDKHQLAEVVEELKFSKTKVQDLQTLVSQLEGEKQSWENERQQHSDEIEVLRKEMELNYRKLQDEAVSHNTAELKAKYTAKFEQSKLQMLGLYNKEIGAKNEEILKLKEEVDQFSRERAALRGGNVELNNKIYRLEQALQEERRKLANLQEQYNIPRQQQREDDRLNKFENIHPSLRWDSFPDCHSRERRLSSESVTSNSSASGRSKVVPDGIGSAFRCAEEEEFPFSASNFDELFQKSDTNLRSLNLAEGATTGQRISELQRRNTLVLPHLRSVYPSEYGSLDNNTSLDEERIRVPKARGLGKSTSGPVGNARSKLQLQINPGDLPGPEVPTRNEARNPSGRQPLSPTTSRVNRGNYPGLSKTKSDSVLTPKRMPTSGSHFTTYRQ